jgi:hypothetical protein
MAGDDISLLANGLLDLVKKLPDWLGSLQPFPGKDRRPIVHR